MASVPFNNLITFSRGSNATLTGPTGLVQWAPNNLLTFSEQFDNAIWTKSGSTVTANSTVAPDGTTTADTLVESSGGTFHWIDYSNTSLVASGTTVTASVYIKANGRTWAQVNLGTGQSAYFDLINGVVGTTAGTLLNTAITSAGNGWYRCSITAVTATSTGRIQVYAASANGTLSYAGDGTSGFFIWGAQLELGSAATTYNSTTVKNLLGFSEAFDNAAWTKSNASIVTGAQANPVNGAFNAQKLMENTAASVGHYILQSPNAIAGTAYTTVIYAKAAERNWLHIFEDSGGSIYGFFNLSTGATGAVNNAAASITSVGGGWYRCALTYTQIGAIARIRYGVTTGNAVFTYTGDGNSGIYIYGAQLSDSASLDPYVPTPAAAPSSTAYYGPRFDYDPVTLAPKGLLVEEARTNLVLYSQQFGDAAWLKSITTVTENTTVSPDGTANADTYAAAASGAGAPRQVYQISKTLTAIPYTWSVYAKAKELNWLVINAFDGTNRATYFNLANGTVGTVAAGDTATIQNVGNGWYRCSVTRTAAATANGGVSFELTTGDNILPINANLTAGSGIFLYGAQLEAGAFATSYIPTVASTVTRAADVATISGSLFSQWYNNTEGTLLANFVPTNSIASNTRGATITDGTNRVTDIYIDVSVWRSFNGTTNVTPAGSTAVLNSTVNFASAYKSGDYAASMNGGAVGTAATAGVQSANKLTIGTNITNSAGFLNGHIRSINFIPARAADFQLQALTT